MKVKVMVAPFRLKIGLSEGAMNHTKYDKESSTSTYLMVIGTILQNLDINMAEIEGFCCILGHISFPSRSSALATPPFRNLICSIFA